MVSRFSPYGKKIPMGLITDRPTDIELEEDLLTLFQNEFNFGVSLGETPCEVGTLHRVNH